MTATTTMAPSAGRIQWHRATQLGKVLLLALIAAIARLPARAQLAITEVQTSQSQTPAPRGADFWELTNFGNSPIDLNDLYFTDDQGFSPSAPNLGTLMSDYFRDPNNRYILAGESMIFGHSAAGLLESPDDFRTWWWGDGRQHRSLKISVADWSFKLNRDREEVQLWRKTGDVVTQVDSVELGASGPGDTFTYDPVTGTLDQVSQAGVNGAFQAATATDVGSPGVTIGPVPLQIVAEPASRIVDGGTPVNFTVEATGLPRPRFQWYFQAAGASASDPIAGETRSTFTIANAKGTDAGEYTVEVSNGLETTISHPALLSVNLEPSCAMIVTPPADVTVTPGQSAIFRVEVQGYPVPEIRWGHAGSEIDGATNATLQVDNVGESDLGLYTVDVSNALCRTNASAHLAVAPPPRLVVTEVMANPSTNGVVAGHNDWWELMNADTYAVNVRGYRFDDGPGVLEGAVVVDRDLFLRPGQCMIWVSSMTPEAFVNWWGQENLPDDLQILSYPGNGFAVSGDFIFLWNATALRTNDFILGKSFVNDQPGVSLWLDPVLAEFGEPSVLGDRGAFQATESDDIGSPGWTSNAQREQLLQRPTVTLTRGESGGLRLGWPGKAGRQYEVWYRDDLVGSPWQIWRSMVAAGDGKLDVAVPADVPRRFFRVYLPPLPP